MRRHRFETSLTFAAAITLPALTSAQTPGNFPTKPVRVVLAESAGGATDILTRVFAAKMSERLGQQFVVDNRTGGGAAGVSVSTMVAKATPDGYTILAIVPSFTFAPALFKNYPVDPIKDFTPISLLSRSPYLLVANTSIPTKTVRELIAFANAQPGKFNFAAGNTGTGTHLVTMWLLSAGNIKATYVPYKNLGFAMQDLLGGQLQAMLANVVLSGPYVKSGKLRALGISTIQRAKALPDIPTIAEQGVTGYDASSFHGYVAPAHTPATVIHRLNSQFLDVVRSPEIVEMLSKQGAEVVGSSPEQLQYFLGAETQRWVKLAKEIGIYKVD